MCAVARNPPLVIFPRFRAVKLHLYADYMPQRVAVKAFIKAIKQ